MTMHEDKKVVILSGGFSEEADVSLVTATEIGKTLEKMAYNVEITDPRNFTSYSEMTNFIKSIDPYWGYCFAIFSTRTVPIYNPPSVIHQMPLQFVLPIFC